MVAKVCGSAEGFREKVIEFPCPCRVGRGLLMCHVEYKIRPLSEDVSFKRTRADLSLGFVQILPTSLVWEIMAPLGLIPGPGPKVLT